LYGYQSWHSYDEVILEMGMTNGQLAYLNGVLDNLVQNIKNLNMGIQVIKLPDEVTYNVEYFRRMRIDPNVRF
jgi:hypothetical protein